MSSGGVKLLASVKGLGTLLGDSFNKNLVYRETIMSLKVIPVFFLWGWAGGSMVFYRNMTRYPLHRPEKELEFFLVSEMNKLFMPIPYHQYLQILSPDADLFSCNTFFCKIFIG